MNPKQINEVAMWLPIVVDGIDIKAFPSGYPYKVNSIVIRSTKEKPVNRFAKNYTKYSKTFSLCFISHEDNIDKVEKFLDDQASKLKEKDIVTSFKMLGVQYEQ